MSKKTFAIFGYCGWTGLVQSLVHRVMGRGLPLAYCHVGLKLYDQYTQ